MPFDSDVALLGTGVAPLVAANHLMIQGKSVLLLNPDWDFYLENSEIPLDPLVPKVPDPKRLAKSSPENMITVLRPEFPGAIEFWSNDSNQRGFHDSSAPHVHQRGRLWISSTEDHASPALWGELEDLYVGASDAGLKPQVLEGIAATTRFPGFSGSPLHSSNYRALYLPRLCDVDSVRYRNGLLEYIRERLGSDRVLCSVNSIECMPGGVRFRFQGSVHTAKLREGMLVFWTPRLTSWILNAAKKAETVPRVPKGVRIWEQWALNSREPIEPMTVGIFNEMAVWADFDGPHGFYGTHGTQESRLSQLGVLRAGPLVPLERSQLQEGGLSWASADSFASLSSLCHGFLKWDRFSVRAMRPRAILEWENEEPWLLLNSDPLVKVIPACDGPLMDIVRVARAACDTLDGGGGISK